MIKQRWLAFLEPECLESLWQQLPEPARGEVTKQYARLMARASVAQIRRLRKDNIVQEKNDESNDE